MQCNAICSAQTQYHNGSCRKSQCCRIGFYIFELEIPSVNNLAFAQRSNPKIWGVLGVWDNSTSITNRVWGKKLSGVEWSGAEWSLGVKSL